MTLPPFDPPIIAGVKRWTLQDTVNLLDTYTFETNPNSMSSFKAPWNMIPSPRSPVANGHVIRRTSAPHTATFGGVIRTKTMYDDLTVWVHKDSLLYLTDHLNRKWEVLLDSLDAVPGKTRKLVPWRFTYTVSLMIFGEVV